MWYSCTVPSLHSLSATSEFLEGSQSSDSCLSLQTSPKSGSGRESWRLEQCSKRAQHHHMHTSTVRGWVLCFQPFFSRQGLWNHSEVQGFSLLRRRCWSVLPFLFHICLSSFLLKRRVETCWGPGPSLFSCSLKIQNERRCPQLDLDAV